MDTDYLLRAADEELRRRAEDLPVDHLVRSAARRSVTDALRQLRTTAVNRAGQPGDLAAAVAERMALEDVEAAQARSERLGLPVDHPYGKPGGPLFFRDVMARSTGTATPDALARLEDVRTLAELRTGLTPSSAFVAPSFLVSQYADVPRQARVFAALVPTSGIPKGSVIKLPQLTGGVDVDSVAPNTSPTDSSSTFGDAFDVQNVGWIAATLTTSLQVFEQSWNPQFDQVAGELLTSAFDETVEAQLFSGSGSSQQLLGVLNASNLQTVSYTDSSPTQAECLPIIGQALAKYARARKATASAILTSPERWAWLASGEDSTGRPLLNVGHAHTCPPPSDGRPVPVGTIFGVAVFTTTGIPTDLGSGADQDVIVVTRPEDQRLYVGPPTFDAFVDTAGLASDLSVVMTFSASGAAFVDRYPSVAITGTGLVAPSGY